MFLNKSARTASRRSCSTFLSVRSDSAAFASAISQGEKEFQAIAICGDTEECWPCGMCRQFMYEFAPELVVVTGSDPDHLEISDLTELLKDGFRLERK
jgi:cytidine deaminase